MYEGNVKGCRMLAMEGAVGNASCMSKPLVISVNELRIKCRN